MGAITVFRAHHDTLTRLPVEADTLDEATLQTGHGTYSVFRLYPGGRVLRLSQHLERMRRSAALLGEPFPLDDGALRAAVRRAVEASGLDLPRVRLTVPYAAPDTAIIALEPFTPPAPAVYAEGVRVGLAGARRSSPAAKDSRFIETRARLRSGADVNLFETLLHDEQGRILEGTSSNFYAVLDGALCTAGEGVLDGVARSILLEVAPAVIPLRLEPVHTGDLPRLSEALLTSASRGVVPIVAIDGQPVGTGRPGPVVRALAARYDAQVERELEPL